MQPYVMYMVRRHSHTFQSYCTLLISIDEFLRLLLSQLEWLVNLAYFDVNALNNNGMC